MASEAPAGVRLSRFANWRAGAENRFQTFRFTPYQRFLVVGLVLLLYVVATGISASRQLWHDELYTYYIAQAPTLPQLFHELRLDLNPPLEYLVVRASLSLLGHSAYATRLPSIIAFFIGSLCFYRFVWKRLGEVYGLLAVLAFWATPFFRYATEARPYALVVAWFGLAILAWDKTSMPNRSRWPVLLLAGTVAGMVLSHVFGLVYVAPLCLAEAWREYRRRRFDWAVWVALLWPAIIALAFVGMIARFEGSLFPSVFVASPRRLAAFYYHTLLPETPALLIAAGLALLLGFRSKRFRTNAASLVIPVMSPVEIVLTLGLLGIPELLTLVLMKTHGGFFPRYAILSGLGYALVLVFAVARFTNASRFAAAGACCVLFVYDAGAIHSAYEVRQVEKQWPAQEAAIGRVRPDLPLVIASGLTFFELSKYAMPSTAQRLYYLTDWVRSIKYAHATMFQNFGALKKYFPIRGTVERYPRFVAEHPQFLVFGTPAYPEDWLLRCLYDEHATVKRVGTYPAPFKDHDLFEVTMPRAALGFDSESHTQTPAPADSSK